MIPVIEPRLPFSLFQIIPLTGFRRHRRLRAALTAFATPGMGLCLPMLYTFGSWFLTGNDIAPCAVLPKSLSLKLFGTDRPSGSAILIGQTEYMICGVYSAYGAVAEEKDFLHTISSDGIPRVYLFDPLRVADVQVSMLYMTDAKGSDAQYLLDQASGFQKKALSGSLTDYRPRLGLAASLWYFSVLVCALFVFTLLLYAAGHQLIAAASAQKEAGKKRLLRLLAGVAATAGVWRVLSSLLSRLAIPPSYLPRDNVFELSFYVRTVEAFFASLHAAVGSNPDDWVFLTHTLAILLWSLLGLVFFIPAALKCRRILLTVFRRNG